MKQEEETLGKTRVVAGQLQDGRPAVMLQFEEHEDIVVSPTTAARLADIMLRLARRDAQ